MATRVKDTLTPIRTPGPILAELLSPELFHVFIEMTETVLEVAMPDVAFPNDFDAKNTVIGYESTFISKTFP